jgi:hypothetical protein
MLCNQAGLNLCCPPNDAWRKHVLNSFEKYERKPGITIFSSRRLPRAPHKIRAGAKICRNYAGSQLDKQFPRMSSISEFQWSIRKHLREFRNVQGRFDQIPALRSPELQEALRREPPIPTSLILAPLAIITSPFSP